MNFRKLLSEALSKQNLSLSDREIDALEKHFELLSKWNKTHNLSAIRDEETAVYQHYVDCILGLRFLKPATKMRDIGSGAGFPGIVAAILWPSVEIELVESSRKKCSFLRIVIKEIGLNNVRVIEGRAEELAEKATHCMTRATFSPDTMKILIDSLARGGEATLWVGSEEGKKYQSAKTIEGLTVEASYAYRWPGIQDRFIFVIRKK